MKTALVTGGTSGIGLQISLMLLRKGVHVIICGRNFNSVQEKIAHELPAGAPVSYIKADFTIDKDLVKLVEAAKKTAKKIHYLVHSAGVFYAGRIEEASIENFDELYKVNTRAPFFITKELLEPLQKSQGRVVFINSTAGINSWESIGQYAASKHALSAIAGSFQAELEGDGIKVTSVYPAATDTPMQQKIHLAENRNYDPEKLIPAREVAEIIVDLLFRSSKTVVSEIVIRSLQGRIITKKRQ
ncbi:MAG: SDR family NAD(P)-dependent oxidoreductase [Bacteroidales bacterium]|nr:SDR family NAD(P)-dependent oxidoreductase [Bacteroidales bacterium]